MSKEIYWMEMFFPSDRNLQTIFLKMSALELVNDKNNLQSKLIGNIKKNDYKKTESRMNHNCRNYLNKIE